TWSAPPSGIAATSGSAPVPIETGAARMSPGAADALAANSDAAATKVTAAILPIVLIALLPSVW
ncbi:MAG TPA: hypothetical protein VIR56_08085, partial [Solimonas sp.]